MDQNRKNRASYKVTAYQDLNRYCVQYIEIVVLDEIKRMQPTFPPVLAPICQKKKDDETAQYDLQQVQDESHL